MQYIVAALLCTLPHCWALGIVLKCTYPHPVPTGSYLNKLFCTCIQVKAWLPWLFLLECCPLDISLLANLYVWNIDQCIHQFSSLFLIGCLLIKGTSFSSVEMYVVSGLTWSVYHGMIPCWSKDQTYWAAPYMAVHPGVQSLWLQFFDRWCTHRHFAKYLSINIFRILYCWFSAMLSLYFILWRELWSGPVVVYWCFTPFHLYY